MAYHFSANQFETPFKPKRLQNWEVPKWYPPRPRQRKGSTKVIANDRGHLLPTEKRSDSNPWGNFKSTFQLPNKLTKKVVNEYNDALIGKRKWRHLNPEKPPQCHTDSSNQHPSPTNSSATSSDKRSASKAKPLDLEYIPGDFTKPEDQHPSRDLLLKQKEDRDVGREPELQLNDLYLGQHECTAPKFEETEKPFSSTTLPRTPPQLDCHTIPDLNTDDFDKMNLSVHGAVTEKPNERSPSPVIPAYANFETARRMHQDNLEHHPLPDCVADQAYRRLQACGGEHPGLALDMHPIATGVGVKMYNAGPTHCTKMKVYRPKTCGVVPKGYNNLADDFYRPLSSVVPRKNVGAMDLAIGWDYQPLNPADEPPRSKHIDGSNDSAGPAVFNFVETPRTPPKSATGRSVGVFKNTFGEPDFFDKDIMRKKTDFTGRIPTEPHFSCPIDTTTSHWQPSRARSVSRDIATDVCLSHDRRNRCQSSPNIPRFHLDADEHLKENYMRVRNELLNNKYKESIRNAQKPSFFRKTARMCHKIAPDPCSRGLNEHHHHHHHHVPDREVCKAAFRVGVPKYNAAGLLACSGNSGCGTMLSGSCEAPHNKVLVVPRPRNPYSKKSYDIDTLVPPFTSYKGGAGQGGYPEHWRLASVYQHAYKPIDQRKRPLLQTVYK